MFTVDVRQQCNNNKNSTYSCLNSLQYKNKMVVIVFTKPTKADFHVVRIRLPVYSFMVHPVAFGDFVMYNKYSKIPEIDP